MTSTGWSHAEILVRLGLPPDYVPATGDEAIAIFEKAVDLLRTSETKSGYQEVYPMRKRWQAKPYLEPGDQRNLGSFATPRSAAMEVLSFKMGSTPLPQKGPPKAKGGTAEQPRRRPSKASRLPAAGSSPVTVHATHLNVQVDDEPPPDSIVVRCEA